ncbi:MAG: hypothetical protein QNK24_16695 [Desulfuromusa sp.]|nr:hypothetical protein [Desulfuromusa sp.]
MNRVDYNSADRKLVILSAVVLSAMGAMFYNLLPLFLGVSQDYREMSDRGAGLLGSMYFAGHTLTTITAFFWIRLLNWRVVTSAALTVGSLALLMAGFSESQGLLMLCIFVAGGAFSAVYGIGTTVLADTSNPARWYGLKISAEATLGAILILLLPELLISRYGFMGMMSGMVLAIILLAPMLAWLPGTGNKHPHHQREKIEVKPHFRLAMWSGLFAAMAFMFSATLVWTFLERMASAADFEFAIVSRVLSLTLIFAVLGSLVAVVLGERFGSSRPLGVATALFLISLVFLSGSTSLMAYAIGACMLTFAIGLGLTYLITIVAELDLDGRYVVLTVPAIGVGVMIAPAVGGLLLASGGFSAIFMVGGMTVVLSLMASYFALRTGEFQGDEHRIGRKSG